MSNLTVEIQQMDNWWHKLIFICNREVSLEQLVNLNISIEVLNLNLILSEELSIIPKIKYPIYVEEIIQKRFDNRDNIYVFQHIDILFDPILQTHPIRLFENMSKQNKLIILWPGIYKDGKLIYAESGHPEHFICSEFEGEIMTI
ncbi:BREX-3 system P-loop-containing protein BrxF [Priestia megaterium]|uniref:BREX-3 system P-loop-containing protein BrxF n=1 Tax=Priestia megaterium TaxID=1404 RepID=UPI00234F37F1|nr:BREX-3 system P-loop-containing protein BrxF [Priestia megaterium]MDC7724455.1 BREX-3 system P-loop-containing protein BrxF [Priestia megaterium]